MRESAWLRWFARSIPAHDTDNKPTYLHPRPAAKKLARRRSRSQSARQSPRPLDRIPTAPLAGTRSCTRCNLHAHRPRDLARHVGHRGLSCEQHRGRRRCASFGIMAVSPVRRSVLPERTLAQSVCRSLHELRSCKVVRAQCHFQLRFDVIARRMMAARTLAAMVCLLASACDEQRPHY